MKLQNFAEGTLRSKKKKPSCVTKNNRDDFKVPRADQNSIESHKFQFLRKKVV